MLSLVFAVLRSLAAALHSRRHLVMENLAKLGLQVSAATVRKYRPKGERGPSVWRSNHSGFDRKRAEALSWTLPCPRRRPAHPYLEYRAICHAGPAIPSTVHHDWGHQAPRSSRKIHRVSPRGCRMEFLPPIGVLSDRYADHIGPYRSPAEECHGDRPDRRIASPTLLWRRGNLRWPGQDRDKLPVNIVSR